MDADEMLRSLADPPEVLASMEAYLADRRDYDPSTWDADQERAARAAVDEKYQGRVTPVVRRFALSGSVRAMFEYRPGAVLGVYPGPLLVAVAEAGGADDMAARERRLGAGGRAASPRVGRAAGGDRPALPGRRPQPHALPARRAGDGPGGVAGGGGSTLGVPAVEGRVVRPDRRERAAEGGRHLVAGHDLGLRHRPAALDGPDPGAQPEGSVGRRRAQQLDLVARGDRGRRPIRSTSPASKPGSPPSWRGSPGSGRRCRRSARPRTPRGVPRAASRRRAHPLPRSCAGGGRQGWPARSRSTPNAARIAPARAVGRPWPASLARAGTMGAMDPTPRSPRDLPDHVHALVDEIETEIGEDGDGQGPVEEAGAPHPRGDRRGSRPRRACCARPSASTACTAS